jgi:hypothetical protein
LGLPPGEQKGKAVINEVILTESKLITVKFPAKIYMVVWTPVLATQHIAPEPGIIVFNKDYSPSWNVGGTQSDKRMCCGPPKSSHEFTITFSSEEMPIGRRAEYEAKELFEKLLDKKTDLTRKMGKCKGLTEAEKEMVLEKLSQTAEILRTTAWRRI